MGVDVEGGFILHGVDLGDVPLLLLEEGAIIEEGWQPTQGHVGERLIEAWL